MRTTKLLFSLGVVAAVFLSGMPTALAGYDAYPDLIVEGPNNGVGDGLYNFFDPVQTQNITVGVRIGHTTDIDIFAQNDDDLAADAFTMHGCGSSGAFGIHYVTPGGGITGPMTGGGYLTASVSTHGESSVLMSVHVRSGAGKGKTKSCVITQASSNAALTDLVTVTLKTRL